MKNLILSISILFVFAFTAHSQIAVVIKEKVNLRNQPSITSPVLTRVNRGVKLTVITNAAPWYFVQTDDGDDGWIHGNAIRFTEKLSAFQSPLSPTHIAVTDILTPTRAPVTDVSSTEPSNVVVIKAPPKLLSRAVNIEGQSLLIYDDGTWKTDATKVIVTPKTEPAVAQSTSQQVTQPTGVTSADTPIQDYNAKSVITIANNYFTQGKSIISSDKSAAKEFFSKCIKTLVDNDVNFAGEESWETYKSGLFERFLSLAQQDKFVKQLLPKGFFQSSNSITSSSSSESTSKSQNGTDVSVKGYYRKNGTYVAPYKRSLPGKGKH